MNIALIIPARLKSKRLKNKVIIPILKLPMIEHVRRRAIISKVFKKIFIATQDNKIIDLIKTNKGNIIKTKNIHRSGTSRVGEAVKKIRCNYVAVLFADEPLINPNDIRKFILKIKSDKLSKIWSATAEIKNKNELNDKSVVKCVVKKNNEIQQFTRKINFKKINIKNFSIQKSVGIFCFSKKVLLKLLKIKSSNNEKKEKIEQIKFLENNFSVTAVKVGLQFPSINTNKELNRCLQLLKSNYNQKKIYNKLLKIK